MGRHPKAADFHAVSPEADTSDQGMKVANSEQKLELGLLLRTEPGLAFMVPERWLKTATGN